MIIIDKQLIVKRVIYLKQWLLHLKIQLYLQVFKMKNKKLNPICCKKFDTIGINHGFFTRNGGVSSKESYSLNCSYSSNDNKSNVLINRKLICKYFNLNIANLKTVNQIHSNKVKIIENIYNNKILEKTIESLINLGSDINNIKLAIGPCIGPSSYEVRNDFYLKFTKNNVFNKVFFEKIGIDKFKFNLPKYILHQAINLGINKNNISNTDKDTFSNEEDFFSYRRNYNNKLNDCGRMISAISIKKIDND